MATRRKNLNYSSILQRFSLQSARIYCSSKEREGKKQSLYILGHYLQTDNNCHEDPEVFLLFRNENQREQKGTDHRITKVPNHNTLQITSRWNSGKSLIPRRKIEHPITLVMKNSENAETQKPKEARCFYRHGQIGRVKVSLLAEPQ